MAADAAGTADAAEAAEAGAAGTADAAEATDAAGAADAGAAARERVRIAVAVASRLAGVDHMACLQGGMAPPPGGGDPLGTPGQKPPCRRLSSSRRLRHRAPAINRQCVRYHPHPGK